MKVLLVLMLTFITCCAKAQTILFLDNQPMSPFCKVMAPLMGLIVVGAIGYAVVKAIGGKGKV